MRGGFGSVCGKLELASYQNSKMQKINIQQNVYTPPAF